MQGERIDLDLFGKLTDRLGRVLQRLGIKRTPRDVTPTVDEYIEHINTTHEANDLTTQGIARQTTARQGFGRQELWHAWRVLLIASMGERLTATERETFTALTGRPHEPDQRVEEFVAVVGRRGGKSRAMSTLAAYIAALCKHDLVPGEVGIVFCIAPGPTPSRHRPRLLPRRLRTMPNPQTTDRQPHRRHPRTHQRHYHRSACTHSSDDCVDQPTSPLSADEAAFWYSDEYSANADVEILNAVRPGLATTSGPLIIASVPIRQAWRFVGCAPPSLRNDGDPSSSSRKAHHATSTQSLTQSVVDRALARDHAAASCRIPCTIPQRPRDVRPVTKSSRPASVITSNGTPRHTTTLLRLCRSVRWHRADSFTLAIGHRDGERFIIDAIREVRPRSPPSTSSTTSPPRQHVRRRPCGR